MYLLCLIALCLMVTQTSTMVIHKQCFQKEKSLAVLELAKDSISKAKDLLPECDGGSNKTACGKKEQAAAYIEAALELIEEAKKHYPECSEDITQEPEPESLPRDCLDVLQSGNTKRGFHTIRLAMPDARNKTMDVFCDMETDGGGWTVIQRRNNYDVQENFFRNWSDYKEGFGHPNRDFWIGNDNIYYLSNVGQSEIRIDMQSLESESAYDQYSSFRVDGEDNLYKLHISGHSGNAGNSLWRSQNGMFFSTIDKDNDKYGNYNCAKEYSSGWWFNACGDCNLNGLYTTESNDSCNHPYYKTFKQCKPLKSTEIKIRRKQ